MMLDFFSPNVCMCNSTPTGGPCARSVLYFVFDYVGLSFRNPSTPYPRQSSRWYPSCWGHAKYCHGPENPGCVPGSQHHASCWIWTSLQLIPGQYHVLVLVKVEFERDRKSPFPNAILLILSGGSTQ